MADKNTQEKLTFNVNIVELAKIDYLVSNGFYSNRSDFLRAAVRDQLKQHDVIISDEAVQARLDKQQSAETRSFGGIGILHLSKQELIDRSIALGAKLNILVFGSLIIDKNIDLDLFKQAIQSVKVYGVLKGPADIVQHIKSVK